MIWQAEPGCERSAPRPEYCRCWQCCAAPKQLTRLLLRGSPSEKSAQRLTPAGAGPGAAGLLAACLNAAASILGVTGTAAPAGMTRVAWSHLAAAGDAAGRAGTGAGAGAGGTTGLERQLAIHWRASSTLAGTAPSACRKREGTVEQ